MACFMQPDSKNQTQPNSGAMMIGGRNLHPMTRELLSQRVHHSIKERGVDLHMMLKEAKDLKHEMTQEEMMKLERKRLKNRMHAKLSRERRNQNFAKKEEICRHLKMEIKILRTLIAIYYRKANGQDVTWTEITLQSPRMPNSSQGKSMFDNRQFQVKVPCGTIDILQEDTGEPCQFEKALESLRRLISNDIKGTAKQEDNTPYSKRGFEIQSHIIADVPARGRQRSTSFSSMGPSECEYLTEDMDILHTNYCFIESVDRSNPVRAGSEEHTSLFNSGRIKGVMNESKEHSPWMVDTKRENTPCELRFNTISIRNSKIEDKNKVDNKIKMPFMYLNDEFVFSEKSHNETDRCFRVNRSLQDEEGNRTKSYPFTKYKNMYLQTGGATHESTSHVRHLKLFETATEDMTLLNHSDIYKSTFNPSVAKELKMPKSRVLEEQFDLFSPNDEIMYFSSSHMNAFHVNENKYQSRDKNHYVYSNVADTSRENKNGLNENHLLLGLSGQKPFVHDKTLQDEPSSNLSSLNLSEELFLTAESLEPSLYPYHH